MGHALTGWADLWDPRYADRIGLRAQPRAVISLTLRSLGYSLNSESPQAIEVALSRGLELKGSVTFLPAEAEGSVPPCSGAR